MAAGFLYWRHCFQFTWIYEPLTSKLGLIQAVPFIQIRQVHKYLEHYSPHAQGFPQLNALFYTQLSLRIPNYPLVCDLCISSELLRRSAKPVSSQYDALQLIVDLVQRYEEFTAKQKLLRALRLRVPTILHVSFGYLVSFLSKTFDSWHCIFSIAVLPVNWDAVVVPVLFNSVKWSLRLSNMLAPKYLLISLLCDYVRRRMNFDIQWNCFIQQYCI